MKLSREFLNDFKANNVKIGDIITFKRSEYETNGIAGLSNEEFVQKWKDFTAKLNDTIKFKLMPAKFDPSGNGVSLIVTRLNLMPTA